MKRFDVILTNPPFQNRTARKRTPHKVWIDFTRHTFDQLLKPGGLLLQISPASFQSPSSKVLRLMREHDTRLLHLDVSHHFPGVGSSFAYYAIRKQPSRGTTRVVKGGKEFRFPLDSQVRWLPADLSEAALSIHRKTMWGDGPRLDVRHDYVTCHNLRLADTLSKTRTKKHRHPVFHTNAQTWYSAVKQPWAGDPKVMWTRSGYTKPFVDPGKLGGTDMAYFVVCESLEAAEILHHNLQLPLFQYILRTAKWSGFGNEIVFHGLPQIPDNRRLTPDELYEMFGITSEERRHVEATLG